MFEDDDEEGWREEEKLSYILRRLSACLNEIGLCRVAGSDYV